jgi:hypothetical protein
VACDRDVTSHLEPLLFDRQCDVIVLSILMIVMALIVVIVLFVIRSLVVLCSLIIGQFLIVVISLNGTISAIFLLSESTGRAVNSVM